MSTAYFANGIYTTIETLTCPNGHSNRNIDLEKFDADKGELPCEFKHIRTHWRFTNDKKARSELEQSLFARYGHDIPIAILAVCRICGGMFFYSAINDNDVKSCQCFDCELARIRERKHVINEFALLKVCPGDYARAKLGLPKGGNLNNEQSRQVEKFLERPLETARRASYVPRPMPRVTQSEIKLEEVPF